MLPKKTFLLKISLVFTLLAMVGCAGPAVPSPTPTSTLAPSPTSTIQAAPGRAIELGNLTKTRNAIKVTTEATIVHYQDESWWQEDQYPTILDNKDEFGSDLMAKFSDSLSGNSQRAVDTGVDFDESKRSTILRCDIHGAVSEKDNSYYAVFSWLLRPLGLDFIDDDFRESEKGLFWEGSINGIPTTVTVELPIIDHSVYKAWQHPIGHCHAHAWWVVK